MNSGQLKPGYNLQISTENQLITSFDFYPSRNDTVPLPSFLSLHQSRYGRMPDKAIADAGYGSEKNCAFMEEDKIEAFVKYSYFHKNLKRSHQNSPFHVDSLYCNSEEDYSVCPMGQRMLPEGTGTRTSENGYCSQIHIYRAGRCAGCPMRGQCHKAPGNRKIEISHALRAYRREAGRRLTSEEGLLHRSRRPIELEVVFGQMKANRHCKRFRHFGKDSITMDFAVFAIAFNTGKMFNRDQKHRKTAKTNSNNQLFRLWGIVIKIRTVPKQKIPIHVKQSLICAA